MLLDESNQSPDQRVVPNLNAKGLTVRLEGVLGCGDVP